MLSITRMNLTDPATLVLICLYWCAGTVIVWIVRGL